MKRSSATSTALALALRQDAFSCAIIDHLGADEVARISTLSAYFEVSLREAQATGRVVFADEPALGAALWSLPVQGRPEEAKSTTKSVDLESILGAAGLKTYRAVVAGMHALTAPVVPEDAWYLSILGIHPQAQSQGLGARLLVPTIAELRKLGRTAYLETFTERNISFYQRNGFKIAGEFHEPASNARYTVLTLD
jgi:ribosomal protein S18 acetylase RimI-like enzyme